MNWRCQCGYRNLAHADSKDCWACGEVQPPPPPVKPTVMDWPDEKKPQQ